VETTSVLSNASARPTFTLPPRLLVDIGTLRVVFSPHCSPLSKQAYDNAAKVQAQVELLRDYMRQHFQVMRSHVMAQVDAKIIETGGSLLSGPACKLCVSCVCGMPAQ